ncbi:MAG: DnaA/Hda family protein [Alphaproteobacteria bacterium]|nr:DnaA/Hda family protein [Alphaproteobacteria bacterium]
MQAVTKQKIDLDLLKLTISKKVDASGYSTWIAPLQLEVSGNCLNVVAHNQFSADHVKQVYGNILRDVAADFLLDLNIVTRNSVANTSAANDNVVCQYSPVVKKSTTKQSKCSFNTFVCSDENQFALMACKKMAQGNASFSQMFLYGPSGCGKTMLLNCINAESSSRIVMMSGGYFVSEFARSLRDKTIFSFKDFCRNCDIFILDDINALAGKRATTEEFLQLIIDLKNSGKSIVLSSNVSPNNLSGFDRRIQSLFGSGLVVDMVEPNSFVRKTMLLRAGIENSVATELSKNIPADGHVVNGVINKIKTYTELMNEKVDVNIATRLLSDMLIKCKTPLAMIKIMCDKMCVSYEEICGTSRERRLVRARQVMMCVLKNVTNLSLTEIGNFCGGRDHATVLYALGQIDKQKQTDLMLSAEITDMINICK